MSAEQLEMRVLMTISPQSESYWRDIFAKYDKNRDGRISYWELKEIIESTEYGEELPKCFVVKVMKYADTDKSGYLEYEEFVRMLQDPNLKPVFGHFVERYIRLMIPPGRHVEITGQTFEDNLKIWPPSLFMLIISLLDIMLFSCDAYFGYKKADGKIAALLLYHPEKRQQAWRFITYMLIHTSPRHLVSNLLLQLLVGYPLEAIHGWWRVILVYLAGVTAGCLATSLIEPTAPIAGASGGLFALSTAHLATVVMNWKEMSWCSAGIQLSIFTVLTTLMFTTEVGLVVHLAGAVAGLLVGISVLKQVKQKKWKKQLWWAMVTLYFMLMLSAVIVHIFFFGLILQIDASSRDEA